MGVFSEWSKETGCNLVASRFVGLNPTAPIVSHRKLHGYVSLKLAWWAVCTAVASGIAGSNPVHTHFR